jgi:hypothetical protein
LYLKICRIEEQARELTKHHGETTIARTKSDRTFMNAVFEKVNCAKILVEKRGFSTACQTLVSIRRRREARQSSFR